MDKPHSIAAERESRVAEKIRRELGPHVMRLLGERDVIEIMLNPDGRLWVERLGEGMSPFGQMEPYQAEALIGTIASTLLGTVTRQNPILECELPIDGSRFEALIPPVVAAPTFTIRRKALKVFTLADYIADGIMSEGQREAICEAIHEHRNILVVGGTGSGKTTLTNAIIDQIARAFPLERIGIIEDTSELQCNSENAVITRATADVDMLKLLKAMMRLRPDRILVGEVRGPEALALLKAWNTGHPGGVATIHANSAADALRRIEDLVGEASQVIPRRSIASAVNLLAFIERTGSPPGRTVRSIVQVRGFEGNDYMLEEASADNGMVTRAAKPR